MDQGTFRTRRFRRRGEETLKLSDLPGFAAPLLLLALFLNKPFHIDDALFLHMSDLLPWTILGDASGTLNFLGIHYPDLSAYESTHPVLIPWLLKWPTLFTGGEPIFWVYHLVFLIFPFLVLYFSRMLTKERKLSPHWTWYLILSPIFFVNATNLMTDVAMLAFWMGAVFQTVIWRNTGFKRYLWGSSLCITLALLTSYQSVVLFPLIGAYLVIRKTPLKKGLILLGVPAAILAIYLLIVYQISGYMPFISSAIDLNISSEVASGLTTQAWVHKSVAVFINLGLGLIAVTPILLVSLSRRRFFTGLIGAFFLSILVFKLAAGWGDLDGYSNQARFFMWCLALNGAFWTFIMFIKWVDGVRLVSRNRRRAAYLMLAGFWFLGVVVYNIVFLPYGTARYILPALPPALMLLFIRYRYRFFGAIEWPLLIVSALLSLFMARVDYQQALADKLVFEQVKQDAKGGVIHYSDDAGLARYMPQINGQYITLDQQGIEVGDKLLWTRGLIPEPVWDDLSLVSEYQLPSFWGWSLFDTQAKAGFYRSYDGFLPIWRAPLARRALLYEVNYFQKNKDKAQYIDIDNPNYFGWRTFEFPDGSSEGVMFMHASATITFPLDPQNAYRLTGSVITAPSSWEKDGDGVTATVGIISGDMFMPLWETETDGKNNQDDRTPREFNIQIPRGSNQLWFKIGAGPNSDSRYDGAGWLDLDLVRVKEEQQ